MKGKIEHNEWFTIRALQLVDVVLILIAQILAVPIRNMLIPYLKGIPTIRLDGSGGVGYESISIIVFGLAPILVLLLKHSGFYQFSGMLSFWSRLWQLVQAIIGFLAIFALVDLVLKLPYQNRSVLTVMGLSIISVLLLRDYLVKIYWSVSSERVQSRVVFAGSKESLDKWISDADTKQLASIDFVGFYDPLEQNLLELENMLSEESIDRVIFATRKCPLEKLSAAVSLCEDMGVESCISADFVQNKLASPKFDYIAGQPMLVISTTPALSWSLTLKKIFDRAGSLFLLICSSWLWVFCAIGILISDGRPIFFRQERAGRYGKTFKMWKFRTMCKDAEIKLLNLKEQEGNQMSGPVFKLDNDPRIFKFGHFLRRTSLDELPQLINVLLGEMSLVGPRPMASYEIPDIEKAIHRRKLSVKPGITCIWQVEGRNTITDFDEWVALDLKYIDNWSFWLDVKLLLRTIPAVLFSRGAK